MEKSWVYVMPKSFWSPPDAKTCLLDMSEKLEELLQTLNLVLEPLQAKPTREGMQQRHNKYAQNVWNEIKRLWQGATMRSYV